MCTLYVCTVQYRVYDVIMFMTFIETKKRMIPIVSFVY